MTHYTWLLDMDHSLLGFFVMGEELGRPLTHTELEHLEKHHPHLVAAIRAKKGYVSSGSARNGAYVDYYSATYKTTHTTSLVYALNKMGEVTESKVDTFLLGDLGNISCNSASRSVDLEGEAQEHGTEWNKIVTAFGNMEWQKEENQWKRTSELNMGESRFTTDSNKKLGIYTWIQHAVSRHPGEEHEISFCDDISPLLESLKIFYQAHSDMIPKGTTLKLYQYNTQHIKYAGKDGKPQLKEYAEIKGTGEFHPNYAEVSREMLKCFKLDFRDRLYLDEQVFNAKKESLIELGKSAKGTKLQPPPLPAKTENMCLTSSVHTHKRKKDGDDAEGREVKRLGVK